MMKYLTKKYNIQMKFWSLGYLGFLKTINKDSIKEIEMLAIACKTLNRIGTVSHKSNQFFSIDTYGSEMLSLDKDLINAFEME